MNTSPVQDFAELVGFEPKPIPPNHVHGTTVIAIRYDQGVLIIADRRATMGNIIMFEGAEKIEILDDETVVAISGAYARSLEVCRYLRHAFKYYERLNLFEISTEGKLMEISRALANNMEIAMQGGVFLPIAATYDKKSDDFGVYFFDTAGARFMGADYAAAGSGSERIRGVFEFIARTKGKWSTRPREDVLVDAVTLLELAADMDSATSGVRRHLPVIADLTRDGVRRYGEDEILAAVQEIPV
jgi:proteasome beta subunit